MPDVSHSPAELREILRGLNPIFIATLGGKAGDSLSDIKRLLDHSVEYDLEDLEAHGFLELNRDETKPGRRVKVVNASIIDLVSQAAKACAEAALHQPDSLMVGLSAQYDPH